MTNRNSDRHYKVSDWHYKVAACVALMIAFTIAGFAFQHVRLDTARDIMWCLAVASFVAIWFAIPGEG